MTEPEVRLESVFEAEPEPTRPPGDRIEVAYGGPFLLPDRVVYANFVSSIDGVAAIEGVRASSATISGGARADRFVMALLRAAADAIVVGAGTLREHDGPWTAERAFPAEGDAFRRMRSERSARDTPTLVVVTGSGNLPEDHPALPSAVVVTTAAGARRIADRGIRCEELVEVGDGERVKASTVIDQLRRRGHQRILTEGGPRLMGSMLEERMVDQLFLTISPKLLGGGGGERPPFSDGVDLLDRTPDASLLGIRRAGSYLFLRYRLGASG